MHPEQDTLRSVPYSPDAEQAVLGAILISPSCLPAVRATLSEDDFYHRHHRVLFSAITAFADDGRPFDAVTLGEWLEHNAADSGPASGYVIELASTTPSAANVEAYAAIVREKSLSRQLIQAGTDIANEAFDASSAPADLYIAALAKLTALGQRITTGALPPVDLFQQAAPPVLRPEWLPPTLSEFIFKASEVKGSPPEVLALSALVACSAAAHDQFRVQPRPNEPGWTESARLWGMVVGDPSAMKSPPMKLSLAPLREMNMRFVDEYKSALGEHQRRMDEFKATEKKRVKAVADGDGLPDAASMPAKPRNQRVVVNDATIEKMADLLSDNPRGLLYFNDELAGWFASMDLYSKGGTAGRDRSYWLQFYEGGSLLIDRMSRETTVVENASVCVLGAIQPERIRAMAQRMDDDGLLQRFIVTVIPTAQRFPSDAPEPTHLHQHYKDIVRQIWNTAPGDGPCIVGMDPGAVAIQTDLMASIRALVGTEGLPPMLRSHLAKWPGLFPRLCLTYHLIACAAARKYPTEFAIAESTARRVADLMTGWILPSAITFYTGLMGQANPTYALARKVADLILGRSMTRVGNRDISQFSADWRSAADWQQRGATTMLEQAGWLLPDPDRKMGWTVNPRVHSEFEARAERIRVERERVNGILAAARARAAEQQAAH